MGCVLRTVSKAQRAVAAATPASQQAFAEQSLLSAPARPHRDHSQIDQWRAALFRTVALGALMVYGGRPVQAACVGAGTTLTCTGAITGTAAPGVVNGGITVPTTPTNYIVLNVNNLTNTIAPNSGVDGINMVKTTSTGITINSVATISATGAGGDGMIAYSRGGTVNVSQTGDVTSALGLGVYARSNTGTGVVSVTTVGNINSRTTAIVSQSSGGNVSVDSTGTVTSATAIGIYGITAGSATNTVKSNGAVTGATFGIFAQAATGAVAVTSTGAVTSSSNRGIYGRATSGSVTITSTGDIRSATNSSGAPTGTLTNIGIHASNTGAGAVKVTSTGNITSFAQGILARTTDGASVTVDSTGNITTTNTATSTTQGTSAAISAQNANGATAVTVTSKGDLTSSSMGIYARAGATGAASITNNSGNAAGVVNARTYGLFAQSAGGDATINTTGDVTSTTAMGIWAQTSGVGNVSVTNAGDVTGNTIGILARSTAGNGSVTVANTGDISNSATAGTLGVYARNSGTGTVKVTNDGDVTTRTTGIYARSSGGGKAQIYNTGDITSTTLTGLFAQSTSGDVTIKNAGTINAFASGMYANATTGVIAIESTGDVSTLAYGIKSAGGTSSSVAVQAGASVYGYYGAVQFSAGGANTLNNYGTLTTTTATTALGLNSRVVLGSSGNETVNNYNLIIGSVNLDGGTNAFNNRYGGFFYSGSTVSIGATNTMTNEGVLTPGGFGVIQTTALTGNFVQTSTGTFTVDIDQSALVTNDLLTVTGTADFAGYVFANPIAITTTGSTMISTAVGGLTNTAEAVDTTKTDFKLEVVNGSELWLSWLPMSVFDLFSGYLTPNQEATAVYLDTLRQSGPSAALLALIDAVKGQPNEAEILMAIDRLHPEHYLAQVNDTLHSSYFFVNSMMSCPTASGENAVVTEGQCLWAKVAGRLFEQDRTTDQHRRRRAGIHRVGRRPGGAGQRKLAPRLCRFLRADRADDQQFSELRRPARPGRRRAEKPLGSRDHGHGRVRRLRHVRHDAQHRTCRHRLRRGRAGHPLRRRPHALHHRRRGRGLVHQADARRECHVYRVRRLYRDGRRSCGPHGRRHQRVGVQRTPGGRNRRRLQGRQFDGAAVRAARLHLHE